VDEYQVKDNVTLGEIVTGKTCVVKSYCLGHWSIVCNMLNRIFYANQMRNFGIFISNYRSRKATFLDGDSDTVGIMMHASGKSVCIISGSEDYAIHCNTGKIYYPSELVREENIYENT
jgi:hypothetical protein